METILSPEELAQLAQLKQHGWVAFSAGALFTFIKCWRKPFVQGLVVKISPKLAWDNWPKWACFAFVVVLSVLGAVVPLLAGGTQVSLLLLGNSLVAAVISALSAMGTDSGVAAVVGKPNPTLPPSTSGVSP